MQLSEYDKSRTRYHLGYNSGAQIPAGDRGKLEEAMALIPDEYWHDQIIYHLKRCDVAWKASAAIPDDFLEGTTSRLNPSRQEFITGDVQRQISTSDPLKGDSYFREIYLREVDRLAESLYVPNYRRPDVQRYAFERSGGEYVMALPGPADTSVGSRLWLAASWR
tara:strand:- start:1095 stop:1589 length:495 start_codon:yes stop_codon:yes gene_type:complete